MKKAHTDATVGVDEQWFKVFAAETECTQQAERLACSADAGERAAAAKLALAAQVLSGHCRDSRSPSEVALKTCAWIDAEMPGPEHSMVRDSLMALRRDLEPLAWSDQVDRPEQQASATPITRGRRPARDVLAPLIDRLVNIADDPSDTAALWGELERLARLPEAQRPLPLAGVTSGGVTWLDGGQKKTLERKAFGARIRRRGKHSPAP